MTLTYRHLNDGLPSAGGEALRRFPSDARSARNWVAALPRANAQAAQMELSDALDSLAGQRLKGTQRLLVLEELRPAVLESVGLMKRQYAGSSLPLPGLKARAAQQAETFQLDMAGAYRKAAAEICAPEGRIPMLRSAAVTKALQRSAWHYSQAANLAWRLYRSPAEGVWQGLHRIYRFAAEQRLQDRPVEEAGAGNQETVLGLYVQALLMSVANPLAYSQSEQDTLWQLARSFSGACPLQRSPQHDRAACVPEDADQGPGQRLEEETNPLWLDLRALSDEVSAAMARAHDGIAAMIPGSGMGIEVSVEALQRLQRAFGMAAARAHRRRLAGHSLQTVFGMSALHFYLAGRRDFDTFVRQAANDEHHDHGRASWAVAATDAAKVPLFPARVLDQSLGGYRLSWDQAQLIRARVGELIGINLAEDGGDPDWMLGVVRWLRYEPGDTLAAGVELLSRRTLAIGLRTEGTPGVVPAKAPVRALAFAGMEAGAGISYLATGPIPASPVRLGILRDLDDDDNLEHLPVEILANVERVLAMGDYTLLKPLPTEPVAQVSALPAVADVPAKAVVPVEAPDTFVEADVPVEPAAAEAEAEIPVEPVDAYAEPDEPLELLAEFSTSYELIEPVTDEDEIKPDEGWDIDRDYLR